MLWTLARYWLQRVCVTMHSDDSSPVTCVMCKTLTQRWHVSWCTIQVCYITALYCSCIWYCLHWMYMDILCMIVEVSDYQDFNLCPLWAIWSQESVINLFSKRRLTFAWKCCSNLRHSDFFGCKYSYVADLTEKLFNAGFNSVVEMLSFSVLGSSSMCVVLWAQSLTVVDRIFLRIALQQCWCWETLNIDCLVLGFWLPLHVERNVD